MVSTPQPRSATAIALPTPPAPTIATTPPGGAAMLSAKAAAKPLESVLWPTSRPSSTTTVLTAPTSRAPSDSASRSGITASL